mmetsp:Transcript_41836/g.75359  ORF Transcript_41836/g.75359 Transcript_41836/m.75359 type:complete len:353 (+) Transcript_41836:86-1144(+)
MTGKGSQLRRAFRLTICLSFVLHYCDVTAFSPSTLLPPSSLHTSCSTCAVASSSLSFPSYRESSSSQPLSSSMQDTENNENSSEPQLPSTIINQDGTNVNFLQSIGNKIIMQAALQCGATEPMLNVEWKADSIVVTVDVHGDENYEVESILENEDDVLIGENLEEMIDLEFIEEEDENIMYDDDINDDDIEEEFNEEDFEEIPSDGISLPLIARTINELLAQDGEDSLAFSIAKLHEISVTTPEWDNVLRGKLMFETYKGFDVLVEHWEKPKKLKKKKNSKATKENVNDDSEEEKDIAPPEPKLIVTEGKLAGRDYEKEVTMISVKGRVVKIKNDKIEGVRLPTAKREKGAK